MNRTKEFFAVVKLFGGPAIPEEVSEMHDSEDPLHPPETIK